MTFEVFDRSHMTAIKLQRLAGAEFRLLLEVFSPNEVQVTIAFLLQPFQRTPNLQIYAVTYPVARMCHYAYTTHLALINYDEKLEC